MNASMKQSLGVVRLKLLTEKIGSGKTPSGGREVYSEEGIVFLRSQNVYDDGLRLDDVVFIDESIDSEMKQTRVHSGDILLNITGASIGRTCIVPPDFPRANVNQHVCILRLQHAANTRYVAYTLKSLSVKDQIRAMENGSSREGLNFEQVGNLEIRLPPLAEQRAIADFLDRKTAQIDALIAGKRRQIELLGEKRQALISQAVTKGLDPTAPMKPSGIPWLGDIPAHWAVDRLRWRMKSIGQGWSPQCETRQADPGEWGVLKVGCMNTGTYDETENKALPPTLEPLPELEIKPSDVLMSRSNTVALVGMVGMVHQTQGKILLCDKLYRLRFDERSLDPRYAVLLLRSHCARQQIERDATGASPSMKNISNEVVGNATFGFPSLPEQEEIVKYVSGELQRQEDIVQIVSTQITKLQEYRQTLISAAVTGKLQIAQPPGGGT